LLLEFGHGDLRPHVSRTGVLLAGRVVEVGGVEVSAGDAGFRGTLEEPDFAEDDAAHVFALQGFWRTGNGDGLLRLRDR